MFQMQSGHKLQIELGLRAFKDSFSQTDRSNRQRNGPEGVLNDLNEPE